MFQFSYVNFINANFKAGGSFFSFQHSASILTPLSMDHLTFLGNSRGTMQLTNSNNDPTALKKVVISFSSWHQNFVEATPLISVIGNAELQLLSSNFTENYSFGKGTALFV